MTYWWTGSALVALAAVVQGSGAPLDVVVSVPPHAWLVEEIGGTDVEVRVLVAPGESPETYRPSDAQVTRLMRSALYFRTGLPFEEAPWFAALRREGRTQIHDLRQGIDLRSGDPHIWLSPRLLRIQARGVTGVLAKQRPARRSAFQANLEQVEARIEKVDEQIRVRLAPHSGRAFFVFHPSWGYFARDYGLRQVAIEIEGKEPSDSEMTALQAEARREGVSIIFVQPQISSRSAAAIAETIGARIEILDPLARDVISNLESVASRIEESFR